MSRLEKVFWRVFNVCVRIVGVGFIIAGGIICLWGVSLLLRSNSTISVNGVPTDDVFVKTIITIVPFLVALLGVLLVRAPYYEPSKES